MSKPRGVLLLAEDEGIPDRVVFFLEDIEKRINDARNWLREQEWAKGLKPVQSGMPGSWKDFRENADKLKRSVITMFSQEEEVNSARDNLYTFAARSIFDSKLSDATRDWIRANVPEERHWDGLFLPDTPEARRAFERLRRGFERLHDATLKGMQAAFILSNSIQTVLGEVPKEARSAKVMNILYNSLEQTLLDVRLHRDVRRNIRQNRREVKEILDKLPSRFDPDALNRANIPRQFPVVVDSEAAAALEVSQVWLPRINGWLKANKTARFRKGLVDPEKGPQELGPGSNMFFGPWASEKDQREFDRETQWVRDNVPKAKMSELPADWQALARDARSVRNRMRRAVDRWKEVVKDVGYASAPHPLDYPRRFKDWAEDQKKLALLTRTKVVAATSVVIEAAKDAKDISERLREVEKEIPFVHPTSEPAYDRFRQWARTALRGHAHAGTIDVILDQLGTLLESARKSDIENTAVAVYWMTAFDYRKITRLAEFADGFLAASNALQYLYPTLKLRTQGRSEEMRRDEVGVVGPWKLYIAWPKRAELARWLRIDKHGDKEFLNRDPDVKWIVDRFIAIAKLAYKVYRRWGVRDNVLRGDIELRFRKRGEEQGVAGWYASSPRHGSPNILTIYADQFGGVFTHRRIPIRKEDVTWAFVHELAHRVYFRGLSTNGRNKWQEFINSIGRGLDDSEKAALLKSGLKDARVEVERVGRIPQNIVNMVKSPIPSTSGDEDWLVNKLYWRWKRENGKPRDVGDVAALWDWAKRKKYSDDIPTVYGNTTPIEAWPEALTNVLLGRERDARGSGRTGPLVKKVIHSLLKQVREDTMNDYLGVTIQEAVDALREFAFTPRRRSTGEEKRLLNAIDKVRAALFRAGEPSPGHWAALLELKAALQDITNEAPEFVRKAAKRMEGLSEALDEVIPAMSAVARGRQRAGRHAKIVQWHRKHDDPDIDPETGRRSWGGDRPPRWHTINPGMRPDQRDLHPDYHVTDDELKRIGMTRADLESISMYNTWWKRFTPEGRAAVEKHGWPNVVAPAVMKLRRLDRRRRATWWRRFWNKFKRITTLENLTEETKQLPANADGVLRKSVPKKLKRWGYDFSIINTKLRNNRLGWHAVLSPKSPDLPPGKYTFNISKSGFEPWRATLSYRASAGSYTVKTLLRGESHESVNAAMNAMKQQGDPIKGRKRVPRVRVGDRVRGEYRGTPFTGKIGRPYAGGINVKLDNPITVYGAERKGVHLEPHHGVFGDDGWFELTENITEVFDNPFSWKWVGQRGKGGTQLVAGGKASAYTGVFSDGERAYRVSFWRDSEPVGDRSFVSHWEVHFQSRPSDSGEDEEGWEGDITGTGGKRVFRVFATVAEMMRKVHQREAEHGMEPSSWTLWTKADAPSRVRLYKVMAKRVAREMGWKVVSPVRKTVEGVPLIGFRVEAPVPNVYEVFPFSSVGRPVRLSASVAESKACPMPIYGGLPEAGGFNSYTEYEIGAQRMAEALHCLLGSVERSPRLSFRVEKGHITEEIGIVRKVLREYSRPIYSDRLINGYYDKAGRDYGKLSMDSIEENAPKLMRRAERYLGPHRQWFPEDDLMTKCIERVYRTTMVLCMELESSVRRLRKGINSNAFASTRLRDSVEMLGDLVDRLLERERKRQEDERVDDILGLLGDKPQSMPEDVAKIVDEAQDGVIDLLAVRD